MPKKGVASQTIPGFYRVWFTIIHPMLATIGVLTNHFSPNDVLQMASTTATIPPGLETSVLLKDLAGYRGGFALIEIFALRARPTDVNLWRIVQTCWLFADVSVLATHLWAVSEQDRLHPGSWRLVEFPHIVVSVWLILLRLAFALGIGLNPKKSKSA